MMSDDIKRSFSGIFPLDYPVDVGDVDSHLLDELYHHDPVGLLTTTRKDVGDALRGREVLETLYSHVMTIRSTE